MKYTYRSANDIFAVSVWWVIWNQRYWKEPVKRYLKAPFTSLILQLPLIIESSSKRSNNSNTLEENDTKKSRTTEEEHRKRTPFYCG